MLRVTKKTDNGVQSDYRSFLIAGMEKVRPAEENESVRILLRPPPLWGSGVSDFLLPVQMAAFLFWQNLGYFVAAAG